MASHISRAVSLTSSLLGAGFNFTLALQLAARWRSLRDVEWEDGSERVSGIKLVWGLLAAYFAVAATISAIGAYGITRRKAVLVRFYRDYAIADLVFTGVGAFIAMYVAFRTDLRTLFCEELERQPALVRDLGLSLETCEIWFERGALVAAMVILVIVVIRIHFMVSLSNYYGYLSRDTHLDTDPETHQRIYLLPTPTAPKEDDVLIYAPVPLSELSRAQAAGVSEAWISLSNHSHHHGHRGRIRLPINSDDEGLKMA